MKKYSFSDLIDVTIVQKLAEAHYHAAGMPIGILDAFDGSVLAAAGWQDICTSFHRANPKSLELCKESDSFIKSRLPDGEASRYKCKNGLWDIAIPIMVEGIHLANMFLGQFFYEGETPDREIFVRQAVEFGFDLESYMEAFDRVPVFSLEKVEQILAYNKALARFIAELAERSLHQMRTEEQLLVTKYCIDKASIGIYHISEEGNIRSVNEYACQSLGYSWEELCSMTIFDIDPTFTREVFIEHRTKLSDSGSRTFETVHRRKDGSTFPVEITVNFLEFRGRKFTLSFAKDITARKRAEEELRLTKYCVDKASLGIYRISMSGDILGVNDYACECLGYSKDELCAMSVFDINPTYNKENFVAHGKNLRESGSITIETIHRRKDGAKFPVEVTANHVGFHGKKFIISFVKDITERKRAEEQLKTSLREKEVLLKEIHHRVKNNLQIISSLLELQSDYITDGKSRSIFRESQHRIRSMALVHQKLYQSRDFSMINFADYIKSLASHLFNSYAKNPDQIELSMNVGDVFMDIDRAIPCGLLINELVSNSLKHAFPGNRKGKIEISMHAGEEDLVTLTVADDGVGLPPGLDFRDTESLGLQLVTMLTNQLGGDIDLREDGGVSFTIRFKGNER
ncbi:MAG TPA: PocR ligand-binding domain-containing protein [Geobacteraceae bacterium]|nr:PocR ligand-binding domain-containing protein [Geobacteraceae bacterium]